MHFVVELGNKTDEGQIVLVVTVVDIVGQRLPALPECSRGGTVVVCVSAPNPNSVAMPPRLCDGVRSSRALPVLMPRCLVHSEQKNHAQLGRAAANERRKFTAIHGIQHENPDTHYWVLTQPIEIDRWVREG